VGLTRPSAAEEIPSLNPRFQGDLPGAKKDAQSITRDWQPLQRLIDAVLVREVKQVLKNNGNLTEVFRADWNLGDTGIGQVFQNIFHPGGISAWHVHARTTDRIFVNLGHLKVVLYDAREGSPTYGLINEFRFGTSRPGLLVVPPGVWHGVHNLGDTDAGLLNLVDHAYDYESPDHWRLPPDSPLIPYSFAGTTGRMPTAR
jgi:dTDP-4-dehydrorhamnose 3,5-epimerase